MGRIERGEANITVELLYQLADVIGVTPDALLPKPDSIDEQTGSVMLVVGMQDAVSLNMPWRYVCLSILRVSSDRLSSNAALPPNKRTRDEENGCQMFARY
eukprot:TRINITY_DN109026_c0_g1_i1.p3 TRINITY_DN109026_c0_g1~~TRINITY_DN109026_c0_g1_i1.p3  ORF type:complete len:101 (+),score=10.43 TRINITY_DN109026_c0_g1_i1:142-444(+)